MTIPNTMNPPLHLLLLLPTVISSESCPTQYTGHIPTPGCTGYIKCVNGVSVATHPCTEGTLYDAKYQICNWPSAVMCNADNDDGYIDEEGEVEGEEEKDYSKYCPQDYTGRVPTKDCDGYVHCRKGNVKLAKDCPTGAKFDLTILACTFAEVECQATIPATLSPSPRIIIDESCPPEYTGNKAVNGCSGYIYCAAGTQLGEYICSPGTVYDITLGYCNWSQNVNTDVPGCATSSPSYMPTADPTISPSYTPTSLDLDGELFYPDYKNGICRNDNMYPPTLTSEYLKYSAHTCCTAFFNSTYDRCMQAPSNTPIGAKIWYPDYDYNLCRSDLNYSLYEVNFFSSYESCCTFDFLDRVECLMKKPSALGLIYYPHHPSGTCKNDGRQSANELWLYTNKEDCCKNDQVQFDVCMQEEDEGDMKQNSSPTSNYYPDYDNHICLNDGKASKFVVNYFPTYNSCCNFSWIDTEKCLANQPIPNSEKYYPILGEGYCRNDGNAPATVTLSNTSSDCCKRYFLTSEHRCIENSIKRWYPDYDDAHCKNDGKEPQGILMSETFELCCHRFLSGNKTQCNSLSKAFTILTPTGKPSITPNQSINSDGCRLLVNKKRCSRDNFCSWKEEIGACVPIHSQISAPTIKPSLKPSNQSITNELGCQLLKNKKQCAKDDTCRWDDTLDKCLSLIDPDQSDCELWKNKRQCKQNDACEWNDTFDICMQVAITEATVTTTTNSPTYKPTKKPTNPTLTPIQNPTRNPSFSSPSAPTTDNDGLQKMWYPIVAKSRCILLPSSTSNQDAFATYTDCCSNPWMNDSYACLEDAKKLLDSSPPSHAVNKYYPDYFRGSCLNDGKPPASEENVYDNLDDCCHNEWLDYSWCKEISSLGPLSNSDSGKNKYYPDYFFNVCRNDGNQQTTKVYLFDNVGDCCGLEYMEYEGCINLSD